MSKRRSKTMNFIEVFKTLKEKENKIKDQEEEIRNLQEFKTKIEGNHSLKIGRLRPIKLEFTFLQKLRMLLGAKAEAMIEISSDMTITNRGTYLK